jgi:hypothetical protein
VGDEPVFQLAGDPATLVLPLLPNVSPARAAVEDLAGGLLLSRISLVLTREATVADFNAATRKVGATAIAFSRTNSPFMTLAVPRQPNGAALKRLAALLRDQPGIALAVPGRQPEGKALPSENGVTASADSLGHLWASGFPAAWNVRALAQAECGSRKVTVIIPDLYLAAPFAAFQDQVPGASENFDSIPLQPQRPDTVDLHGYEVAAALAGKFDGTPPAGANPFPDCLKIVPVDVSGFDFFEAADLIRTAIEREEGKVIVNASVGYPISVCGSSGSDPCPPSAIRNTLPIDLQEQIAFRVAAGVAWAEFAMQPAIIDDTLFAVAAGNERNSTTERGALGQVYAGFRNGRLASPFAIATQLPTLPTALADAGLWTSSDFGHPILTLDTARNDPLLRALQVDLLPPVSDRNLALVGSTTRRPIFAEAQRASFSNDGADLYAVGEEVTGLVSPLLQGSSFSTAQVAGLASYLWLLDRDLRSRPVEETLRLIRGASRKDGAVEGFLDAYAAVLALDALHQTKQIRKALLDVNDDGLFNHLDLRQFAEAYQLSNPNRPPLPATRDFSRYDLNGDGYTGGIATERFDLDADGLDDNSAPRINTVTTRIEGIEVPLKETALTDLQILCYYAYAVDSTGAPLIYDAGSEAIAERRNLLPSHCVSLQMEVVLPNNFTESATMTVKIRQPNDAGSFDPAPGLLIQLTPDCATVSPASGRTNANGQFSAAVAFGVRTDGTDCFFLSVVVEVRRDEGSPLLAQQTVRASFRGPGVRLNRLATTKAEVTHASGLLVRDAKTSIYPPTQAREYTPPNVALSGSGSFPPPPDPPASSYTYAADYAETVSATEVERDTVTGGELRLTASCAAEGSARITVDTTGLVSPYLQFPAGRFQLVIEGTLAGAIRGADFFEARFTLRKTTSTLQSVTLTSRDGSPSRPFTNRIDVVGPGSYDLGMSAKTVCVSGSPARSADTEVALTFSITPIE